MNQFNNHFELVEVERSVDASNYRSALTEIIEEIRRKVYSIEQTVKDHRPDSRLKITCPMGGYYQYVDELTGERIYTITLPEYQTYEKDHRLVGRFYYRYHIDIEHESYPTEEERIV